MRARETILALAFVAATLAATGTTASADPAPSRPGPAISERLARDIAWSLGLVHIEEIALWGAFWEIAGRDRDGNEKALDIDASDGRVID